MLEKQSGVHFGSRALADAKKRTYSQNLMTENGAPVQVNKSEGKSFGIVRNVLQVCTRWDGVGHDDIRGV